MSIDDILDSAQFIFDKKGEKTAVQLDFAVWEKIVELLNNEKPVQYKDDSKTDDWQAMMTLIRETAVDTGIEDLAIEHDHYLYGKPKSN